MAEKKLKSIHWAMAARKGGVGKTANCCLHGAYLSSLGYKVALIDLNTQNDMASNFDADIHGDGICEFLKSRLKDKPNLQEVSGNLFVLNGGESMNDAAFITGKIGFIQYRNFINHMEQLGFDFIISDIPPENHRIEHMAVCSADQLSIVMKNDSNSFKNGMSLIDDLVMWEEEGMNVPKSCSIILTEVPNSKSTGKLLSEMDEVLTEDGIGSNIDILTVYKNALVPKMIDKQENIMNFSHLKTSLGLMDDLDAVSIWATKKIKKKRK